MAIAIVLDLTIIYARSTLFLFDGSFFSHWFSTFTEKKENPSTTSLNILQKCAIEFRSF